MASRHPLPYAYARAHTVLLEDEGDRLVLWAPETVSLSALAEVLRLGGGGGVNGMKVPGATTSGLIR